LLTAKYEPTAAWIFRVFRVVRGSKNSLSRDLGEAFPTVESFPSNCRSKLREPDGQSSGSTPLTFIEVWQINFSHFLWDGSENFSSEQVQFFRVVRVVRGSKTSLRRHLGKVFRSVESLPCDYRSKLPDPDGLIEQLSFSWYLTPSEMDKALV
jgi:hypothetical protein